MGAHNLVGIHQLHHRNLWNTIYALQDNQQLGGSGTIDLLWYRHQGYADGSNVWDGPRTVGTNWRFNAVFPCLDLLYTITDDGRLWWNHHLGSEHGENRWEVRQEPIGTSWAIHDVNVSPSDFVGVFCDTRNSSLPILSAQPQPPIIYALRADGSLLWYRHDGFRDGSPKWANDGLPMLVRTDWKHGEAGSTITGRPTYIFSGCNGIFYLITDDGGLWWYKHTGYLEGTPDWEGPTFLFRNFDKYIDVFSLGEGNIYTIERDGMMSEWRHGGYTDGSQQWITTASRLSGGWNSNRVVCNSASLKTTHL